MTTNENNNTAQSAEDAERDFHRTAQRNALGGYIGCDGPECEADYQLILNSGTGFKVRGVR